MNNYKRKLFGFFSALLLSALALSSGAAFADKSYTLAMSPASGTSPIASMSATFTSTGNSSFNSLTLQLPAGYSLLGTPTVSASKGQVSYNAGTRVITITNIGLPVGAGANEVVTVTMSNVSTSGGACGTGINGNWVANVYGGSSLNGSPYSGNTPSTSISPLCYTITSSAGANGSIAPLGATVVKPGANQGYTITPSGSYHIADVLVDGVSVGAVASYTFNNVQASHTISASFAINTYNIVATQGANGSVAPPGTTIVNSGSNQAYTITASGGYYITDVVVDGGSVGAMDSYTFMNVTANHTITASFARKTLSITSQPTSAALTNPFDVTVGINPGGGAVSESDDCSASASVSASSATSITFTIIIATMPPTGVCNLTFSATDYVSAQVANLKVFKGVLACGQYADSLGNVDTGFLFDPDAEDAFVVPGGSAWGLRRGPNRDGSLPCVKVNYSCNIDDVGGIAACSYDKASGQLATFKYVFVFKAKPTDSSDWTNYRPQVSWNVPNLDLATTNFDLPDWVPMLACVDDTFPSLPTLPTVLLPTIPSVLPFTNAANVHAWYQPGVQALVCAAQLGWTSQGDITTGTVKVQHWIKVIDESDVIIKSP